MTSAIHGTDHVQLRSDIGQNGFPVSLNYFTALPDISGLRNPTITIVYKSLMKKDSTTKEKSLTEFVQFFNNNEYHSELKSDPVIQAWIQIYPKLAFDNSRNVRILSQNVQAKFLTLVGGKGFTKYLKSSLPIWLLSNYDTDKTVSNNGSTLLNECFQNDKVKVDRKIWEIFLKEILHYIIVSLTLETRQTLSDERNTTESDAISKHERIMNGSLMLLNKFVSLINDHEADIKIDEYELEQIETLLDNDILWDYMGIVFTPKTFNSGMANSYLVLLRSIFLEDKQQKGHQNQLCKSISSARSLYKHSCKRFIKDIKIKPSKVSAHNIIYGSIILQFWGTLTVMTKFPQLEGKKKPKESMWELGGSKSDVRLIDYIKLGPCNLDSIYYILLARFLIVFIENSTLHLQDLKLVQSIVDIILDQLPSLRGFSYKQAAIECLVEFIKVLPGSHEQLIQHSIPSLISILNGGRRPSEIKQKQNCIDLISEMLGNIDAQELNTIMVAENDKLIDYIKTGSKNLEMNAYCDLLKTVNDSDKFCYDLIKKIVNLLSEIEDGVQIKRGLELLTVIIKKDLSLTDECMNDLIEFTNNAGALLEEDVADSLIEYLFVTWKDSRFNDKIDTFEMIDDLLTKFEMIKVDNMKFIKPLLNHFNWSYEECLGSEVLAETLQKMAAKPKKSSSEWQVLFLFIKDKKNFSMILNHLVDNDEEEDVDSELDFINQFNELSIYDSDGLLIHQDDTILINKISKLIEKSLQQFGPQANFIKFVESNSIMQNLVIDSLWTHIKSLSINDTKEVTLWDNIDHEKQELLLQRIDEELKHLPNINKDLLAVSNSMGANIYLVDDDDNDQNSSGDSINSSLLGSCRVLAGSSNITTPKVRYYCAILSQYVQDFIFMLNQSQYPSDYLVKVQKLLSEHYIGGLNDEQVNLENVLNVLLEKSDTTKSMEIVQILYDAFNNVKGAHLSYVSRVIRDMLDNLSNSIGMNVFETMNLDLNPLLKHPLKLSIILSGLKCLLGSTKFERIRNFVVAEILGVKSDNQILTDGLKWIVLSINFLEITDQHITDIIPERRLNMALLQFEKWLDSDVCYDEAFTVIRCQLIKFLTLVQKDSNNFVNKENDELGDRLVEDNLSIIQVERTFELRYFTLKYISYNPTLNENSSIKEELLNNILLNEDINKSDQHANNMVINMCQDVLQRCFKKMTFNKLDDDQMNKLYKLICDDNYYQIKLISCQLLHTQIIKIQQDLVIDYQFKRTNEGFNEEDIKLPLQLIELVSNFEIDEVDEMKQFTYLISWYLIFDHFKDINYLIRNQYIAQIRNNEKLLNKFLEFIFEIVEIDNIKVIEDFEQVDLSNISLSDIHFMILHVYYLSCKYLGSEVQSWYNQLRNIQLKQDIEKFTTKNISSVLINQMISQVDDNKSKLITDIMNIKINKVINEIKSTFTIDDQIMEMVIKISNNFPLNNVVVEGSKRLGLTENEWKAWLLSSQRVISLTNGSIIEAIEIFKKNVDLHFSGFEECAICYSILHQDHSLPSKTCSTCSNKFHAACLYKWFKSSGSSTCPLCRSTFNFRK